MGNINQSHIQALVEERRKQYGDPAQAFDNIVKRWSNVLGIPITPHQAIKCMIELKRARLDYNPNHEDSIHDIQGYELCLEEINNSLAHPPQAIFQGDRIKAGEAID